MFCALIFLASKLFFLPPTSDSTYVSVHQTRAILHVVPLPLPLSVTWQRSEPKYNKGLADSISPISPFKLATNALSLALLLLFSHADRRPRLSSAAVATVTARGLSSRQRCFRRAAGFRGDRWLRMETGFRRRRRRGSPGRSTPWIPFLSSAAQTTGLPTSSRYLQTYGNCCLNYLYREIAGYILSSRLGSIFRSKIIVEIRRSRIRALGVTILLIFYGVISPPPPSSRGGWRL